MDMFIVHPFAVLLGGVANMGVGMLWYSPMLFGNQWIKAMGFSAKKLKAMKENSNMGFTYFLSFVGALFQTYILGVLMNYTPLEGIRGGVLLAVLAWAGFVLVTQLTDVLFSEKKMDVLPINAGYQLASLVLMGVVVGMFS